MKILNAYTQSNLKNGYGLSSQIKNAGSNFNEIIKKSGDTVCFSDTAMEMLAHPEKSLANCPQDATYDANGNMNRQLEALQRDLSDLAASAWPANIAFIPQINSLQSQISRLCMQI